ncbi:hypothetical protein IIV25_038L [Invertebrate iridovirus 25]|uniref:Uncharacterized protein n=1 Tax=Invertebrate iridovirus 25 TaxID=1301280 RepID=W8W218_9VIRU|nr:hypothetical protein IIV25_038L [Invertebrate iridovirus 25]CCV02056.1 hypothetical protein IIV25_038L [Invertebrate iridovirus 25]
MATFNQNKYYTSTWGKTTVPFGTTPTTVPFGTTPTTVPFGTTPTTVPFGTTPTTVPFGTSKVPLFGTTVPWNCSSNLAPKAPFFKPIENQFSFFGNLETSKPPLFGSTNLETSKPPLFGSTNLETSKPSLFGTSKPPLFGSTNLETSKPPLFDSTNLETSKPQTATFKDMYNVASNLTLVALNLPKNKIKGLIFMVTFDQKNTLSTTKYLLENVFNSTIKFSLENSWFTSLIKYSDEKFLTQKIDGESTLIKLYSSLLRELMLETITTPEHLHTYLIKFGKECKSKKMLWLFTLLKYADDSFVDLLNPENELETFALALYSFILDDNNPIQAVEKALNSTNPLYKTFLLSMVGASYGMKFFNFQEEIENNPDLTNIVAAIQ